jgi:hypothetical protein
MMYSESGWTGEESVRDLFQGRSILLHAGFLLSSSLRLVKVKLSL